MKAVLDRAGVERSGTELGFADLADLCLQVYIANIAEFDRVVFGAVEEARGWPLRLRVAAYAAVRYVRDRPLESHFNFIEMLEGGEAAQVHRDRYVNRIVDLIDEGRGRLEDPDSASRDLAATLFGSIYLFLQSKLLAGADVATIERFVPELMYPTVLPYLGAEEAIAELSIPPPPEPPVSSGLN